MSPPVYYPTSAPIRATYIPYNEKRQLLSILDLTWEGIKPELIEAEAQYSETVFFDKSNAQECIKDFWNAIRKGLFDFNLEFSQRILLKKPFTFDTSWLDFVSDELDFELNTIELKERVPAKKLCRDIHKIVKETLLYLPFGKRGFEKTIATQFTLEPKDFQIARADFDAYKKNGRTTSCHAYVCYHIHEEKTFVALFNQREGLWPMSDPIDFFKLLGYNLVQEPKNGDLIIYCSSLNGSEVINHWGIWNHHGRVTSKFGMRQISDHAFDSVLFDYGTHVYFFRRKYRFSIQQLFIKELRDAREKIKTHDHPATYYPLTTEGTRSYFLRFFEELIEKEIPRMLPRSLSGPKALARYKISLLETIEAMDIPSYFLKKLRLIDIITEIVTESAENLHIDFTQDPDLA